MRLRSPLLALSLCVGCGARTQLDSAPDEDAAEPEEDAAAAYDAGLDVSLDVVDAPPSSPLCATEDAGVPVTECSSALQVGTIVPSTPFCFVDTVIHTGDQGLLDYACRGDPSTLALATFTGGTFTGGVQGTVVDLCTGTTFPFSDGCTWASAQRITGDIAGGTLSFTYEEQPIQGTKCFSPCSAHGPVFVR